ncbi:MAG TPA: type II secretion system F family protein [Jiangellaceae bacterium]|nr:type II secretion system F family protein [Jiangellaceae bacterium]
MTAALAVALAAVAAGLLAKGRPSVLSARLAPASQPGRTVAQAGRSTGTGGAAKPAQRAPRMGWSRGALAARFAGRSPTAQRETEVIEACLALAAELQAGAPVPLALAAVAEDWPELFASAAARASVGGEVTAALRDAATAPGAGSLRAVAAGWDVTDRTGAPLSRIVIAVADALRTEAAVRQEAHSQLATARATARLLAVLPFGTLVLLSGGDGAAVSFLLGTPIGLGCLGGAVLFVWAGLWWVGRLAQSATRSAWEE